MAKKQKINGSQFRAAQRHMRAYLKPLGYSHDSYRKMMPIFCKLQKIDTTGRNILELFMELYLSGKIPLSEDKQRKYTRAKCTVSKKKILKNFGKSERGIYQIKDVLTGGIYIGSSMSITNRWLIHQLDMKAQKHHNKYLQTAYNTGGLERFEHSCIWSDNTASRERLYRVEQAFLNILKPSYNIEKICYPPRKDKRSRMA